MEAMTLSKDGLQIEYHVIVPGLYKLIQYLVQNQRSFSILFRTFGQDLKEVAKKYNDFCCGKHPLFPNICLDGTNGTKDMRITDPLSHGLFYRTGFESQNTHLITGTLDRTTSWTEESMLLYKRLKDVEIHTSFETVYENILKKSKNTTLAIQDDYNWWSKNGELAKFGKLFLLHKKDTSIHQIFFDDNLHLNEYKEFGKFIVDLRDLETLEHCPPEDAMNVHLVKCEPLHAILDQEYFIKCTQTCEKNFTNVIWKT